MLIYPAVFTPAEEGGFVVTFPDFSWGGTQGETEAEAYEMAQDLLQLIVGQCIRKHEHIPRPGRVRGKHVRGVALPVLAETKIELYRIMRESGVRKAELARRMGQPKQQIERLLNLEHASRLDQIEAAFAALRKQLTIGVRDAA
ncbi:MAG: type II toxin-antitoxin system HicB family antitoxin [Bryobacteraceae bacterium]|jgi:antitoxin HicB